MANALKDQFADPQFQSMAFEDRLGLLVDAEWNARKNNHLNKPIRQETFSDPGACLENVEYLPDRVLKQEELLRFGTCNYIQERHNIILLGATGSGKTYLAYALGMAAARRFCAVKYIRLPDLLVEFQIARGNGTIRKLMAQYRKYALLIIDEWLLYPLKETEARDLLEIVESRYKRNSTIFCSQFDIPGWLEKLSDPLLADAICDRIVHDAYTIVIGGKESIFNLSGGTAQSGRSHCSIQAEPLHNFAGRAVFAERCTHLPNNAQIIQYYSTNNRNCYQIEENGVILNWGGDMFHANFMYLWILKVRYKTWWHDSNKQIHFIHPAACHYALFLICQTAACINTQYFLCAYMSCRLTLCKFTLIHCRGPPNLSFSKSR